jgi:Rrf2 family cysteine metabolism transcriptional repressor
VFSVSAKSYYGLLALYELARGYTGAPLQARSICAAHAIPQRYVEQLLLILKKAGFVKSFRGRDGGYALALPPASIRIADVLKCLEGEISLADRGKAGALDFFWNRVEREIHGVVTISLEDLVLEKERHERKVDFNI